VAAHQSRRQTGRELWASRTEDARWHGMARHLPEIYAVETAMLA
jgi:hypothetical protein